MIVSDNKNLQERLTEIKDILLNIGYPHQLVDDAIVRCYYGKLWNVNISDKICDRLYTGQYSSS